MLIRLREMVQFTFVQAEHARVIYFLWQLIKYLNIFLAIGFMGI